jgi:hypothetical protein
VADAAFISGPWLTLVFIAFVCLARAVWIAREGQDASGNEKHWRQQPRVWTWALAGLGLLTYAAVEWFSHYNSTPASMR